ncbi:hypothetical protein DPEC_G00071210 [Dallia pectoralis]|uniref:Uncharacterized protein n=1 Tax=Dallia pectoralis TaxID=75939 RepID=A0ACC2H276_DALPE|nr:hypothetical protein DPEC_G00071210 [Dallia pectoralis]
MTSPSSSSETVAVVYTRPVTQTHSHQSNKHHYAPIDLLSDLTLLQLFSHLPKNQLCRCARVCRRWNNLAWDPRLWNTVRLTGELLHADRALKVLTHRLWVQHQDTPNVCLTLKTVVASGCRRLTDRGLHLVAQCCPELRCLEVAGCYNISNEAVFEVVSHCPNLEHLNVSVRELSLSDCHLVWDFGLREVACLEGCLRYLSIAHCSRITDVGVRYVARYLNARGCEGLTWPGSSAQELPQAKVAGCRKMPASVRQWAGAAGFVLPGPEEVESKCM